MLRYRQTVSTLTLIFLSACSSSSDPPVTCDAWRNCESAGSQTSVNQLLCPTYIDDPECGRAYSAWLRCYSGACSANIAEAGDEPCTAERETLEACWQMQRPDSGVD